MAPRKYKRMCRPLVIDFDGFSMNIEINVSYVVDVLLELWLQFQAFLRVLVGVK